MELPEELEAALLSALDDRSAYAVAADWLQQEGDPQGELIALSLLAQVGPDEKIVTTPAIDARILELQKRLEPFDTSANWSPISLRWRWGFVRAVHLSSEAAASEPDQLRSVLASPIARALRELELAGLWTDRLVKVVTELARTAPRVLRGVRSLAVYVDRDATTPLDLQPLWRCLPRLERLVLVAPTPTGTLDLPHLRELYVSRATTIDVLRNAALPSLHTLRLDAGALPAELGARLDPSRFPALRRLSITQRRDVGVSGWRGARIEDQLELFDVVTLARALEAAREFVVDRLPRSAGAGLLVMAGGELLAPGTLVVVEDLDRWGIGRGDMNHLVLAHEAIGRRHAYLHRRGDTWHVYDLRHSNGTYLNGHHIGHVALRAGDDLHLGPIWLRFLEGDLEAQTADLRRQFGFA